MPVATVSTEVVHKDLKSAPPDGFVDLRALPYGKMLHRRDNASKLSMEQEQQRGRNRKDNGQAETQKMVIETMQTWTRFYEFKECIVDHNLEAPDGRKLNFNNQMDFQLLNPKVGAEIERYIDELNQEDEEYDEADFPSATTEPFIQNKTPLDSIEDSSKK